jgi:hypothetical protein
VSVNEIADALHEQVNEVRDILDVYECLGLVDRPGADIYSVSSEWVVFSATQLQIAPVPSVDEGPISQQTVFSNCF